MNRKLGKREKRILLWGKYIARGIAGLIISYFCLSIILAAYIAKNYEEPETYFNPEDNNDHGYIPPSITFSLTSPNESFFDTSADICTDLYSYACGNFNYGKENEIFSIIEYETEVIKIRKIEFGITENLAYCLLPGYACSNAFNYYHQCEQDESTLEDRVNPLIGDLYSGLKAQDGPYKQIRFLLENGITNFVHLTKEKTDPEYRFGGIVYTWVHYLRPGGVLFPEKTIHIDLYGTHGLKAFRKQALTLGDWLAKYPQTRDLFGEHAQPSDLLFVENEDDYFKNLFNILDDELDDAEITSRLMWFIRNGLKYFVGLSCLDQTKLLFSVTMCKNYYAYSEMKETDGQDIGDALISEFTDDDVAIRLGGCSSLLHSNTAGDDLYVIESQILTNFSFFAIHQQLFKQWAFIYDPVYQYYTYPRALTFTEDPLDFISNNNAFYDPFHHEAVIPPGFLQIPLYSPRLCLEGQYGRGGFVVGHEITHSTTLHVCEDFNSEMIADIVGLSKAVAAYLKLGDSCNFFLMYAQLFCSANPHEKPRDKLHASCYERVNIPIQWGSPQLVDKFNECYKCNIIPRDECQGMYSIR